jgi:translation initiation factor 2 alpha subunit (eIF-2alpha)
LSAKLSRWTGVKGHIDLSLRRVTEMQKRQKTDEKKAGAKSGENSETLASQIGKRCAAGL